MIFTGRSLMHTVGESTVTVGLGLTFKVRFPWCRRATRRTAVGHDDAVGAGDGGAEAVNFQDRCPLGTTRHTHRRRAARWGAVMLTGRSLEQTSWEFTVTIGVGLIVSVPSADCDLQVVLLRSVTTTL